MKNIDLSKKVQSLRREKGFSQEALALNAGLSIRTIQRIENGKAKPRGDTLQRLASSLNITPGELAGSAEYPNERYIILLQLSALSFIIFPLFGIAVPFILWVLKRNKIKDVNDVGKSLLNCQISLGLMVFVFTASKIYHITTLIFPANFNFLYFILTTYAFNTALIIFNAIRRSKGMRLLYPAIPFLR